MRRGRGRKAKEKEEKLLSQHEKNNSIQLHNTTARINRPQFSIGVILERRG